MKLPLRYYADGQVGGASREELMPWIVYDMLRRVERASIRQFVSEALQCVLQPGMRILDYGCGPAPYRDLAEQIAGDKCWTGYDPALHGSELTSERFHVVLCTQVVQYLGQPEAHLRALRVDHLNVGGALVITYPTNWPVCEATDLWRFTVAGMQKLLERAGYSVERSETRAFAKLDRVNEFSLGGGMIARAK